MTSSPPASRLTSQFRDYLSLMERELANTKDAVQPELLKNRLHNFLLLAEQEKRSQDFTQVW